jgi:hypothetical protein
MVPSMAHAAHDLFSPDLDEREDDPHDARDDVVVLRGVSWRDYQRLLEIRGERRLPRYTYFVESSLGRLVEAWCSVNGIEFTPVGSWTLQSEATKRGVEPDESYCLGENAAREQPDRPDLAIEVVHASRGISKLDVYRKLGVSEVWIWKKDALAVHALRGEQYEAVGRSELLPGLDLELLLRFVRVRPVSRAVREYREALGEG